MPDEIIGETIDETSHETNGNVHETKLCKAAEAASTAN